MEVADSPRCLDDAGLERLADHLQCLLLEENCTGGLTTIPSGVLEGAMHRLEDERAALLAARDLSPTGRRRHEVYQAARASLAEVRAVRTAKILRFVASEVLVGEGTLPEERVGGMLPDEVEVYRAVRRAVEDPDGLAKGSRG